MSPPDETGEDDGRESGQSTIEYGLIVGFVVILIMTVFVAIGPGFRNLLEEPVDEDKQDDRKYAISSAVYN